MFSNHSVENWIGLVWIGLGTISVDVHQGTALVHELGEIWVLFRLCHIGKVMHVQRRLVAILSSALNSFFLAC